MDQKMASEVKKKTKVLVTGSSGFIGAHVVQQLLQEGYTVRGTVRSMDNPLKVDPLKKLGKAAENRLELVEAELLDATCWDDVVEGCDYVMHVASPFPLRNPPDENEIIRPAVEGTLNVLKACTGKVKRVVLTSSCAAIGAYIKSPEDVFSEEDWTDLDDPVVNAYMKSKTLAEKTAWEYQTGLDEEQKFELAVINPSWVFGPVLTRQNGASIDLLTRFLVGGDAGLPRLFIGIVDVREVARAHVVAMTLPEAAGNRHIITTDTMSFSEIGAVLKDEFESQGYKPTTRTIPDVIVVMGSWINSELKGMRDFVGKTYKYDTKRMREILKIESRPKEETLNDMVYSLIEAGKIHKTKLYRGKTTS